MQVDIRLFGALRQHLPSEKRGRTSLTLPEDATVQQVIDQLTIHEFVIVAINDEQAGDYTTPLHNGDTVLLFEAAAGG
ncbi:MAG: MoaD/ThiS family protein [Phototrophicaceae bacterium]